MSVRRRTRLPFPAPALGARDAIRLWRLVLAGWLVSATVLLPFTVVVGAVLAPLDRLPTDLPLPSGEALTVVLGSVAPATGPLVFAVLSGCLLSWLWGALWRASVVGWRLWAAANRPPTLGELLGLGLVRFGRFLRLGLTSTSALVVGLAVVWTPAALVLAKTGEPPPSGRLLLVALIGGAGTVAVTTLVALAALRGAWLLGRADRRSAVAAWLRGLDGAVRQPVASFGTLLLWWMPAVAAALWPLLLGWRLPALGDGHHLMLTAVLQLAILTQSVVRVALLASFAPTSGLPLQS